jgi:hypothetical protein
MDEYQQQQQYMPSPIQLPQPMPSPSPQPQQLSETERTHRQSRGYSLVDPGPVSSPDTQGRRVPNRQSKRQSGSHAHQDTTRETRVISPVVLVLHRLKMTSIWLHPRLNRTPYPLELLPLSLAAIKDRNDCNAHCHVDFRTLFCTSPTPPVVAASLSTFTPTTKTLDVSSSFLRHI